MKTRADVLAIAEREYRLHPTESWGKNWGPRIKVYQEVTRAYKAAWCVTLEQFCLAEVGLGPIANRTAGVWYLWNYAGERGWRTKKPEPGSIVIFPGIRNSGHTGFLERVEHRGDRYVYHTVEGNSGDTISKRERRWDEIVGFVNYPASRPKSWKPAPKPPLFQLVVGEGKAQHVVAIGPWGTVRARVPQLVVAKGVPVLIKRRWRL